MWNGLRACKTVALLGFLLPWVTISCSNQKIATASGFDLARGSLTVINPMTRATESYHGDANNLLIGAIVAIVAGLLIAFLLRPGRGNAVMLLGSSLIALLLSAAAMARIDSRSVGAAAAKQQSGFEASLADSMIRVDYAYGFWVTMLALLGAAILAWMVLQAHGAGGGSASPVHASNEPQAPI